MPSTKNQRGNIETTGDQIVFEAASGQATTLQASADADRTLILPNASDTLVGKATADIFTNKQLTAATITANSTLNLSGAGTLTFGANATTLTIGDGSTAVTIPGTLTVTGDLDVGDVQDDTFRVVDEGDNTKKVAFQLSGATTGTTTTLTASQTVNRAIIFPDADAILVGTDTAQALTAKLEVQVAAGTTPGSGSGYATLGNSRTVTSATRDVAFSNYMTIADTDSGSNVNDMEGILNTVAISGTDNNTYTGIIAGMKSTVSHGGSGTIDEAYGVRAKVSETGAGTITTGASIYAEAPSGAGITNAYAVLADGVSKFAALRVTDTTTSTYALGLASNSDGTALDDNRTLTFDVNNANRTIDLSGDLTLANNLTTAGNFALTLTTSATTNATIPAGTVTLVDLGTAQTFTAAKTFPQTGLLLRGADANTLNIKVNETLTGAKTLNVIVNDTDRTVNLSGNLTLGGAFTTDAAMNIDLTTTAPVNGNVLSYDGANWVPGAGGSGSGEINFNLNPNSVAGVAPGLEDYGIGDYVSSGSGATVGPETTSGNLPRGFTQSTGTKITLATGTADYVRLRFKVDEADRNKKLKMEWAQKVASYTASTAKVALYTNTASDYSGGYTEVALHGDDSSGDSYIPNQTGVYYNEFDADDSIYYELRFINAGATAGTITINDLVVGPGKLHSGAVVTAWQASSTKSTIAGLTGTQTEYWRRVGTDIEVIGELASATAGSGQINITSLPEGYTPDTTTLALLAGTPIGLISASEGTTQYVAGLVVYNGASDLSFYTATDNNSVVSVTNATWNSTSNIPFTWSGDFLRYSYKIPVSEWAGSGVLNTIVQDNLTELTSGTLTLNSDTSTSQKALFYKRVGDEMEIQFHVLYTGAGDASDFTVGVPGGYTIDTSKLPNTTSTRQMTGIVKWYDAGTGTKYLFPVYNNTTSLKFIAEAGTAVIQSGSFANNDSVTGWIRVPIAEWAGSQSSLVGFSEVTQGYSGLVKSAGQLKGTNTNDSAAAGYVGEFVSDTISSLTTGGASGAFFELGSITLTPGDWDVSAWAGCNATADTMDDGYVAVSTATASAGGATFGYNYVAFDASANGGSGNVNGAGTPVFRVSVSSTTTYYLNVRIDHTVGAGSTPQWRGSISARRVR